MNRFFPGIAWALLILTLSSLSPSVMSVPQFWDLFSIDKLAHAVFYGILFFLFARAVIPLKRKKLLYILTACIAYGILIEWYQGYILTSRTADWVDALANAIGAAVAFVFVDKKMMVK